MFAQQVAIVTGAAGGIGFATAELLVQGGASVVLADMDGAGALRRAQTLQLQGYRALACETDVSCEADVIRMVAQAVEAFGHIHILINNAAMFDFSGLEATVEQWQRIMAVNIMGYALCVKHTHAWMQQAGGGSVVNVASISGHIAQPQFLTYSATKGAVVAMTRNMALDLAPFKIRVNAVSPGTVYTDRVAGFLQTDFGVKNRQEADAHPELGGRYLLKRCASPIEISRSIAFLASSAASFITGQVLKVDGGYTAV